MKLANQPRVTIKPILDTSRKKGNNTYPVKLRVTYNRQPRKFGIDIDDGGKAQSLALTVEDWDKVATGCYLSQRLKEIKQVMCSAACRAQQIAGELNPFTWSQFETAYHSRSAPDTGYDVQDVYATLEAYVARLKAEGRPSTASSYNCALVAYRRYKKKLSFAEVTPAFLRSFERHFLQQGGSTTTVGIYARSLRTIVNQARDKDIIKEYPFGRRKYEIPTGHNVKKALDLADIARIYNHPLEPFSPMEKYRDLWLFSYFCNGLNVKDICRLQWKNLTSDKITFLRAKTANTKRDSKLITVFLSDESSAIVNKWGNPDRRPDAYMFGFYPPNVTPQQERDISQNVTKYINKAMKRIAVQIGLEGSKLTTYVARHSYATVLKRSGAPIEFISETLGHSDLRTTENYLASFEDDQKRRWANVLSNFNTKRDQADE